MFAPFLIPKELNYPPMCSTNFYFQRSMIYPQRSMICSYLNKNAPEINIFAPKLVAFAPKHHLPLSK